MRSIKESVESGEYFIEARSWYNGIFLAPMKSNAFMLGASLSIMMVLLFTFYSLYNVFPLSEKVRVVVFLENTLNFSPVIKNIAEPGKSVKQSVLEYLSTKYVNAMEVYDPKIFKKNYLFILRSTEKNLFNAYYDQISKKTEENPAMLYKNGNRSSIRVISTRYDAHNNFITVNFLKQNYNVKTGERLNKRFEAKLLFQTSDYNFAESKNARFDFIVTNYELKELNG